MGGVAVFASQMSGHPWQIDLHMYFFATLACLVAYCDWRPIVAGTLAVALHHLILNFVVPAAIFPGGTDLGRVVLHAVILIMEAGVLIWLAFQLEQLFATTAEKTAEADAANAAEARANAERSEAERRGQAASPMPRCAASPTISNARSATSCEAVTVAAGEMQGMSSSMSRSSEETARQTDGGRGRIDASFASMSARSRPRPRN